MIANLILGITCLFLIFFISDPNKGLKWVFFVSTCFLCVRYDWGNDYISYLELYKDFQGYSFSLFDISGNAELFRNNEFGWVFLNRLFGQIGFGFFGLVILLSVFENWVIYHLISKYVSPQHYWVAIVFFLFSTSFCVNSSMFRQYLCMCLFVLVVDIMNEKKVRCYYLWSVGLLLLGSTIHISSVVLLLFLPLFYVHIAPNHNKAILIATIFGIILIVNFYGRQFAQTTLLSLIDSNNEISSYSDYLSGSASNNSYASFGVLFRYSLLGMWLFVLPQVDKNRQIFILLLIASYFFESIASVIPMAARYQMYFRMFDIVCWPLILPIAKQKPLLYVLFAVELIVLLYSFYSFYHNPIWIDKCLHFHTIFEVGRWM